MSTGYLFQYYQTSALQKNQKFYEIFNLMREKFEERESEEIKITEKERLENERMKKNFSKIPFAVILYDILPLIGIRTRFLKKPSSLFGYFKLDKTRTIFFLFPSIIMWNPPVSFGSHYEKIEFYVNLERMNSIELKREFNFSQLGSGVGRMTHLSRLSFKIERNSHYLPKCQEISNLFSNYLGTPGFPSIRDLEIVVFDREKDYYFNFDWNIDSDLWRNVKRLSLFFYKKSFRENFLPRFCLPRCKYLLISNRIFERNYELEVKNVESLVLRNCENLRILSGKNLKSIKYFGNHPSILQDLENITNIEILQIIIRKLYLEENLGNHIDWLFSSDNFNLKSLYLENINFPSHFTDLPFPNLKMLHIQNCFDFNENILDDEFPYLRKLSLQQIKFRGDKEYKWCRNLVSLEIIYLFKFDGSFFLKNKESFENLKEFEIEMVGGELIDSEEYPKIKKIQEILDNQRKKKKEEKKEKNKNKEEEEE